MFHYAASALLLPMSLDLNLQAICHLHWFATESTIGVVPHPASNKPSMFLTLPVSLAPSALTSQLFYLMQVLWHVFFPVFGMNHSDQIILSQQCLWKSSLFPKTCIFKTEKLILVNDPIVFLLFTQGLDCAEMQQECLKRKKKGSSDL